MTEAAPIPPVGSVDVVRRALDDIMPSPPWILAPTDPRNSGLATFGQSRVRAAQPQRGVSNPLPVYSVSLSAAASEHSSTQAELVGWRHLIKSDEFGEDRMALADVREKDAREGGGVRFANLRRGPWAAATARALNLTGTVGEPGQEYAPAVLEIPAVMVAAVWMRSKDGRADVFIPFSPGGQAPQPMQGSEFDKWVSGLAQQQQQMNDALGPPNGQEPNNGLTP